MREVRGAEGTKRACAVLYKTPLINALSKDHCVKILIAPSQNVPMVNNMRIKTASVNYITELRLEGNEQFRR